MPFQSELSKTQKQNALKETPSILELMGWANFPGSFLVGPIFGFRRYSDYVNGNLLEDVSLCQRCLFREVTYVKKIVQKCLFEKLEDFL